MSLQSVRLAYPAFHFIPHPKRKLQKNGYPLDFLCKREPWAHHRVLVTSTMTEYFSVISNWKPLWKIWRKKITTSSCMLEQILLFIQFRMSQNWLSRPCNLPWNYFLHVKQCGSRNIFLKMLWDLWEIKYSQTLVQTKYSSESGSKDEIQKHPKPTKAKN